MTSALDELADAAEDIASDQRRVARRARTMQRQRDRGWSWARILEQEPRPGLLDLVTRSARRLAATTGRFRQVVARGLVEEGWSRRQVAKRFGVTHQRISAMLSRRPAGPGDGDGA